MQGLNQDRRSRERRTVTEALPAGLSPELVAALRQLYTITASADQLFGPSKADSIAALKRAFAKLPAEVLAVVRPH